MKNFLTDELDSPCDALLIPLAALEKRLGISITIHDCRGLFRNTRSNPLLPEYNYHRHHYCRAGRVIGSSWGNKCLKDCCLDSDARAMSERRPFLKSCWKGVTELVVPIVRDNTLMLNIYIGAFRDTSGHPPEDAPPSLISLYQNLPPLDEPLMHVLCGIVRLVGQGILEHLGRLELPGGEPGSPRKQEIARFIANYSHRPIGLKDLASHLHLSPSRTSHLVKSYFGQSFQNLLIRERMTRAKALLQYGNLSLDEIALACGIRDIYYFNRLFRQQFGIPPGRFRRDSRGGENPEP